MRSQVAWAECRYAQERWLINDPIRFAEFDVRGETPPFDFSTRPEADFCTRARHASGQRTEVLLDPASSTYLQVICDTILERHLVVPHSLSARMFGIRLRGEHAYDIWSNAVPFWIRAELNQGRAVVLSDIRDFFASIRLEVLRSCLQQASVSQADLQLIESLIAHIDQTPDRFGHTRTGLPVCPLDFFFLVADLVLGDIDRELASNTDLRHVRWVDDFLISVPKESTDRTLTAVEATITNHGFALNANKRRVFVTADEFSSFTLSGAHELLDHAIFAGRAGDRELVRRNLLGARTVVRDNSGPEAGRAMRRIYGLALLYKVGDFIAFVEDDRHDFHSAAAAILKYSARIGGCSIRSGLAKQLLFNPATDEEILTFLRALLAKEIDVAQDLELIEILRKATLNYQSSRHPLATALALANLEIRLPRSSFVEISRELLPHMSQWRSPMARRLACELFLTVPELRQATIEAIRQDPARTVRGLAVFVESSMKPRMPQYLKSLIGSHARLRSSWGEFDVRLANALFIT